MTTQRTVRTPCGCRHTVGERARWIELCPTHEAEANERHARAQREHRDSMARFYLNREQFLRGDPA